MLPLVPSTKTVWDQVAIPKGKGNGQANQRVSTPGTPDSQKSPSSHTHKNWLHNVREKCTLEEAHGIKKTGSF